MAALLRNQQDIAERGQNPIRHCEFGEKPQPRRQPDREPPPPCPALARPDEGVECRRPARQQRRVGRNDEAGYRNAGQAGVNERGPEPDAPIVKPCTDCVDKDCSGCVEQRRREPHRKLAVAEQPGRQRDQPGDQWRLREVAESEVPRPDPILRFVRVEVRRLQCQPKQAQPGNRRHTEQRSDGIGA